MITKYVGVDKPDGTAVFPLVFRRHGSDSFEAHFAIDVFNFIARVFRPDREVAFFTFVSLDGRMVFQGEYLDATKACEACAKAIDRALRIRLWP